MTLVGDIDLLATRVAEEFNTVRGEVAGKADAEHQHSAADITSGTLDIGRIPTGSSSSTVALGNHNHSGVYAPVSHNHTVSDITDLEARLNAPPSSRIGSVTVDQTANINIDASARDAISLDMEANATLNVPTNGVDFKVIQVVAYANGDDRTLTFHANYERLDGIDQSYVIPEGKKLRASIRCSTVGSTTWIVEAVGVTQ